MDHTSDQDTHLFQFACLLLKTNKYVLARTAWEKYLVARPSDSRGHFNLGMCLESLGERASALSCFRLAFDLQPMMADAAANAAGLLIQEGKAEEASSLCYRALEAGPDCAPVLYNLNTALRMVGRHAEAVALSWQRISGKIHALPTSNSRSACFAAAATAATTAAAAAAAVGVTPSTPKTASTLASDCRVTQLQGCESHASAGGGAVNGQGLGGRDDLERSAIGSLTVACVRWGRKYGPEYVQRLASGVRRNLSNRNYRFVCFTDDVEALEEMIGVEAWPLSEHCREWKGWWHKAFLFSREAGLQGRVLYIDLDTVIAGSLEDIAGYSGPFAALSAEGMANERRPSGLNSSVMSWEAGSQAEPGVAYRLLEGAYGVVTECVFKLDHWLEMTVPQAHTLQKAFPGQIVEYKASCCGDAYYPVPPSGETRVVEGGIPDRKKGGRGGRLPPNARVICFPLEPKPHEVEEDWVQLLWRGERAGLVAKNA